MALKRNNKPHLAASILKMRMPAFCAAVFVGSIIYFKVTISRHEASSEAVGLCACPADNSA